MRLSDIGEFSLIGMIDEMFSKQQLGVHGIGDDCAVIRGNGPKSQLVTTDSLVEDTHFVFDKITPEALGYKSVAVNLSDIAAMGGTPKYMFMSLALPKELEEAWLESFLAAAHKIADEYEVVLLGGDVTGSKRGIFINVTVLAEADPDKIKYRSGAKAGDVLCLTDNIGDSAAGLDAALHNLDEKFLLKQHFYPKPQLAEGQFLAALPDVHAMMDVSDGLACDVDRIIEASRCGVEIELQQLPISNSLLIFAEGCGVDAREFAAIGGEDYCLLAAVDSNKFAGIASEFRARFGRPLTAIGRIVAENKKKIYLNNGEPHSLVKSGFMHFSS